MNPSRQTAIITGASSGIGREAAVRLAKRGMATVLVARRTDRLEALAEELSSHAPATAVTLDLADADAVEHRAAQLVGEFGPIHVLVNNAGVGQYRPFLQMDEQTHRRIMQTNYFAPAAMIRAVLPGMVERGYGRVINVGSVVTKMATWGHSGYCASKSALTALTQALETEHAGTGVRFCMVHPGIVRTEFFDDPQYTPLRAQVQRYGIEPDRVAGVIERMIDHPKLDVLVPGHLRAVEWLRALSPTLTHRLFARSSRPNQA